MTKELLIKELELLADSCDSNYALEVNGYSQGVNDAIDLVKKLTTPVVSGSISVEDTVNALLDWLKSDDCWVTNKDGTVLKDAIIDGKDFVKYTKQYYR